MRLGHLVLDEARSCDIRVVCLAHERVPIRYKRRGACISRSASVANLHRASLVRLFTVLLYDDSLALRKPLAQITLKPLLLATWWIVDEALCAFRDWHNIWDGMLGGILQVIELVVRVTEVYQVVRLLHLK